ncbi:MAG: carbonic anhydrase [Candidatus Bipolaricaulota bacterium]|nr:carbonic anhydrase [Candidatus Bipolaricaulota bacterium]
MDKGEGIRLLREGNERHAQGAHRHPRQDPARRAELAQGQRPWAAVLGCSDSRVPPEIVFDQGLGDLFVVRTAGHVCDGVALASLRYAVDHLGVGLVVVLGHTGCGAVRAAIEAPPENPEDPLCAAIRPAIERARLGGGDLYAETIRLHVQGTVAGLRRALGSPAVVGAVYDLASGRVEFFDR